MKGENLIEEIISSGSSQNVIPGIGSLSELGVREIWKTRCALCARVCFVLEGMNISFVGESRERNLAFVRKYFLQKPLQCSSCKSFLCANCAAFAADKAPISGGIVTPLGLVFRTACPFCVISTVDFA